MVRMHGLTRERKKSVAAVDRRLKRPLVECAHEARPEEEMTPERVADVLLEEEAGLEKGETPW